MAEGKKTYTLEDLKTHNTREDMWIAIHGRVYNITPFLEEHPGGDGVLVDNAGTRSLPTDNLIRSHFAKWGADDVAVPAGVDCTGEFEAVGHSDDARATLEQFYIGDLVVRPHAHAFSKLKQERRVNDMEVRMTDGSLMMMLVCACVRACRRRTVSR